MQEMMKKENEHFKQVRLLPIEWNSIKLSGPAHGKVTKTVHKTLPGVVGGRGGGVGGGGGW